MSFTDVVSDDGGLLTPNELPRMLFVGPPVAGASQLLWSTCLHVLTLSLPSQTRRESHAGISNPMVDTSRCGNREASHLEL